MLAGQRLLKGADASHVKQHELEYMLIKESLAYNYYLTTDACKSHCLETKDHMCIFSCYFKRRKCKPTSENAASTYVGFNIQDSWMMVLDFFFYFSVL